MHKSFNMFKAAVTAICFFLISIANAQESHRWTIGVGIGGGVDQIWTFNETYHYPRLTIPNLEVGYHINDTWTALFYAPGGVSNIDGEQKAFEALTLAAQYRFSSWWVMAGAGLGLEATPFYKVDYTGGPPTFYSGPAATAILGYQIFEGGKGLQIHAAVRSLYAQIAVADITQTHLATDFMIKLQWH